MKSGQAHVEAVPCSRGLSLKKGKNRHDGVQGKSCKCFCVSGFTVDLGGGSIPTVLLGPVAKPEGRWM